MWSELITTSSEHTTKFQDLRNQIFRLYEILIGIFATVVRLNRLMTSTRNSYLLVPVLSKLCKILFIHVDIC